MVKKTRPSCAIVKVQLNLLGELPEFVEIEIKNKKEVTTSVVKIRVEYDVLPKYCRKCKLQGYNEDNCRVLHPNLRRSKNKGVEGDSNYSSNNNVTRWHPTNSMFTRTANEEFTIDGMLLEEEVPLASSFNATTVTRN